MTPILRRVIAGMGANAFGQTVNIGIQVLSLPLFLHRWDLATYGTWLMLSALPSYLTIADVGMVTVAGNEMTMAIERREAEYANSLFQSVLALITLVCAGLTLPVAAAFLLIPLPGLAEMDERLAACTLALGVLSSLFAGLADVALKASHRYATGLMLVNVTRLVEWGGSIAGLFIWGSFLAVALGSLVGRLACLIVTIWVARRGEGAVFRWNFEHARWGQIKRMARPSVSFLAFPLANALTFQGVTLIVGQVLGPASVAVFNTYRTIARVAVQLTGIFSMSLWPEFSRLYGAGGASAAASVYRHSLVLGAALAIVLSIILFPSSPLILRVWTHGAVSFQPLLMALLLGYASVGGLWHVPRVLLMSTNMHMRLASWVLSAGVAVVFLAYFLGRSFGGAGVGVAMLTTEIFIAGLALALAQQLVQERAPATQATPR